ncbi:hypothetical protein [Alkalilimnicola sp. S0819]|nr:hypothetical protein [Alkalilimnicola sp. S0819]
MNNEHGELVFCCGEMLSARWRPDHVALMKEQKEPALVKLGTLR